MNITKNLYVAPEEKLDLLYWLLLKRRIIDSLVLFKINSSCNQFLTFKNTLLKERDYTIYKSESYIVIIGKSTTIIGLDDNFNFFCHNLPYSIKIRTTITDKQIKRAMHFDIHYWEYDPQKSLTNLPLTIRLQGDILLRIEKIFNNTEDLLGWLQMQIIKYFAKFLGIPITPLKIASQTRNLEEILAILQQILLTLPNKKEKLIRRRAELLSNQCYPHLGIVNTNDTLFVISLLKNVCQCINWGLISLERKLLVSIGNHTLKFVGIPLSDIQNFARNILRIKDNSTPSFLLLRTQTIYAIHDEHNDVTLNIKPAIISLDTIPSGSNQITRRQTLNTTRKYRATLVFLCEDASKISTQTRTSVIHNNPQSKIDLHIPDRSSMHKSIILADINIYYICDSAKIIELRNLIRLSLLAKNITIIVVDHKNKDKTMPKIIRLLGKYKKEIRIFILETQKPHYFLYGIKKALEMAIS